MTNKQKFYFNGIVLTVVGLAMRSVGLIFGAYISRTVGAAGIGLNALVMTVYGFALTFATSGISLTVTKLVAEAVGSEMSDRGVLRGAFIYSFLFGTAASVSLYFLSGSLGRLVLDSIEGARALRILSLSLLPVALSSVISGYFVGVKRVSCNAAVNVFGQFIRIALTVLLLGRAGSGAQGAVYALCLGVTLTECLCFLISLSLFFIDRCLAFKKASGMRGRLGSVFGMAFPLAVSAYIRSALLSVEHSLIPKRLRDRGDSSDEALSSYGVLHGMALPLILYPLSPLSSFSGLLVPEFAEEKERGGRERMSRIASRAINATLAYAIAVAVFLWLFSEELGYVIYDSYEAGRFIALITPVVPMMYLDHVADSVLKGIGEHVYSMWVNILDSLLSVVLVFFLIPVFGIGGYAMVIVGMEAFNFTLSILRLKGRIPFRISVSEAVALPLLSAVFAALLSKALFISSGSSERAGMLVLKLIFALCAYFAFHIALSFCLERYKKRKEKTLV